jgi:hypothetical protein
VGCSEALLHALNYSQVAGLFLGMILFGFSIDAVGRKAGSIAAAVIMFVGEAFPGGLMLFPPFQTGLVVPKKSSLCGSFAQWQRDGEITAGEGARRNELEKEKGSKSSRSNNGSCRF